MEWSRRGLVALTAVAIAVRLAAVFAVGSYKLDRVTYEHGEIARNLVEGRGFVVRWMGAEGPTSQQAPVYPSLVAAFYWLFGIQTPAALLALQILQCVMGGLLAAGVVLLARDLLPELPGAGWLAGAGTAFYPTLIYMATQVQVASVATLLVVAVLWIAARASRSRSMFQAVMCGAAGGLLVLTDPILGIVVVVAFAIMWMRVPQTAGIRIAAGNRSLPHSATSTQFSALSTQCSLSRSQQSVFDKVSDRQSAIPLPSACSHLLAVASAAFAAMIAPWIARNYVVHGELVFVKSTFGYAFWQGNHPRSFGTDKIPRQSSAIGEEPTRWEFRSMERSLWRARHDDTLYIDDAVLPSDRIAALGRLSEPARSRQLMAEAKAHIREHPGHFIRLCLQRLRFFLLFDETNPKSRVWVYRASHVALQVIALAGLWLSRRFWRRLWPTYLVFVLVTLFHTLTIVSARFHIPLEPIQMLWAGCGAAELGRRAATTFRFGFGHVQVERQSSAAA
jgi:hypothetical protein